MAAQIVKRESEPFSEINITPMIDVMLVLMVMIIMSIPTMTHKLPIDLPQPGKGQPDTTPPHRLEIASSGTLAWDGAVIGDAELRPRLTALVQAGGRPVLHMRTDPAARYERFDQVLAIVKRSGIERLGFIGDGPLTE